MRSGYKDTKLFYFYTFNTIFKMKYFLFIFMTFGLFSCGNSVDDNQFLPHINVDFTVNLNLSEGINLQVPGGHETFANQGLRGVVIFRRNIDLFVAFDLACPHIELQDCSTMTVGALFMTCPCDNERFQLTDGAPESGEVNESAIFYNVTKNGDILRITN